MFDTGFPHYWSTIKKLIWLKAAALSESLTTLTGAIVSFIASKAKAINALTVTLEPIQEGSGDPSPTNVRPITGWTGCVVYNNEIPSEYQRVEYIESSGTQYIDTGIECTSDLAVDFKAKCSSNVNTALCGGINTASPYFRHHYSPYNNNFYWIQYSNSSTSEITYSWTYIDYVVTVDPTKGVATINGQEKTFTPLASNLTTGKSYGLFARISDTGDIQYRAGRIYYFKFYKNSQLIGYFIPCYRKSDNVIGMFDIVSKTFFTNSGTGTFLKSGDIVAIPDDTRNISWQSSAGTVYGGTLTINEDGSVDLVSTMANIASYNGEAINEPWMSSIDKYVSGSTPTTGAQVVYTLSSPVTYHLSSIEALYTLVGTNNVWADCGNITLTASGITPIT